MKIYALIANTIPYCASRSSLFKGKTSITLVDNLTKSQAENLLLERAKIFFPFARYIASEEAYVKEYCYGIISDQCEHVNMTEDQYFQTHKKQLHTIYFHNRNAMFEIFEGPGYYENLVPVLLDGEDSFTYDTYYTYHILCKEI